LNVVLDNLRQLVIDGRRHEVRETVQEALKGGSTPHEIMFDALIPAMSDVGELYEQGEYYIPEMMISARAMQAGLDILRPIMADDGIKPLAKVVLGTVEGDLHDIGKNLVGMMLRGAGFEVVDLGVDVKSDAFVDAVTDDVQVVGMSALLTTTIPMMKKVIAAIAESGLREKVYIVVGGAPLTQEFAEAIGADGYAPDASRAVAVIKELTGID
jgi:5-methyltetrahydrofolate--homocysteine methyltransferase